MDGVRIGLGLAQVMLLGEVEEAGSPTEIWQRVIRYKTLVLLIKRFERWAEENSISV
jgi:hypothetical protein